MHFSTTTLLSLLATAYADSLSSVPPCAQACVRDAVIGHTSCDVNSLSCICNNVETILPKAAECVAESCTPDQIFNDVLPNAIQTCTSHTTQLLSRQANVQCVPVAVEPVVTTATAPPNVVTATVRPSATAPVVTAGAAAAVAPGGLAALAVAAVLL
ncbi:CFEM domain-containing protein [Ophiocordyceps camponoti-floridani]|uniref:CFEM domain-containing protein n=1 Tax=Ophiocordyceps camponoti-floridani TaxID=2030778 RepID=A0A8H4VDX5_9HYPO|nr:CFEM domain-containing protein [Ophiocordyceps camponoti-floridani]